MKEPVIKKQKNALKMVVAGILITLSIATSPITYINAKLSSYSSDGQIEEVADDLNCDLGYLDKVGKHYYRMEHNGKEPIYVCLDKSLTEEEKNTAIKTLDELFGIVGLINSNYRYELVDEAEYAPKIGKTKIYYRIGERVSDYEGSEFKARGYIFKGPNLISWLTTKRTMNNYVITLDRDEINKRNSDIEYTMRHELLHAFGFNDVYTIDREKTTDKFQGNTYINNSFEGFNMLTPNDVKCLISLYSQKKTNKDKVREFLKEYTNRYYQSYTEAIENKYGKYENFNQREIDMEGGIRVTKEDGTMHGYMYQVNIENCKYEFRILDYFSNKLLDSCSGDVVYVNGMAVLKDVELKTGMRPYDSSSSYSGGFVQDLAVGYLGNFKKQLTLYDYHSNWGIECQDLELEKSIDR